MNVERLHALMLALQSDLDATGLLRRLYDLQGALQDVINHPEPQRQEAVGHALKAVHEAIEKSEVDAFSPAWSGLLSATGFADVLGSRLRSGLEAACQQSHITPSLAKEEIQGRVNEIERLKTIADRIAGAFGEMGLGGDELGEEECEIGFLIPQGAFEGRLDRFVEELREIDGILRTFSEVATEERANFEIRSVASGDFAVYVEAPPVVGALFAAAMERVITVYQQLLQIRRLRSELTAQQVPGEVFERLDSHANRKMDDAIEEIAIELVLEYYPSEDGQRARQLVVELGADLAKVANRIDRGYGVDVRIPALTAVERAEGTPDDLSLPPHFVVIRRASKALRFMRLEGEPILHLSESTSTRKAPPRKKPVTKAPLPGEKKSSVRGRRAKRAPKAGAKKRRAGKKTAKGPADAARVEKPRAEKKKPARPGKRAGKKKREAAGESAPPPAAAAEEEKVLVDEAPEASKKHSGKKRRRRAGKQ